MPFRLRGKKSDSGGEINTTVPQINCIIGDEKQKIYRRRAFTRKVKKIKIMKYRNKNLKLFTSIIVVALVVVGVMIFQACKKEKEFECKDSFKPTFQEINKFSDFAKLP